jgi:hypothetical protein
VSAEFKFERCSSCEQPTHLSKPGILYSHDHVNIFWFFWWRCPPIEKNKTEKKVRGHTDGDRSDSTPRARASSSRTPPAPSLSPGPSCKGDTSASTHCHPSLAQHPRTTEGDVDAAAMRSSPASHEADLEVAQAGLHSRPGVTRLATWTPHWLSSTGVFEHTSA